MKRRWLGLVVIAVAIAAVLMIADAVREPRQPEQSAAPQTPQPSEPAATPEAREVVTDPDSVAVLVNKQYGLPDNFEPDDLVYPDVTFIFEEKVEKRLMRREAAEALERMFEGAKRDGIHLGGVSAFRSHGTQRTLFDLYVKQDGEENAMKYSAVPGHSEHQTGLSIDLSDRYGNCAVQACFADMEEFQWLAEHAPEYGFILRYPEGKEHITGYQYEPWHYRYVGVEIAREMDDEGLTLEEYYGAVPVDGQVGLTD